MSATVTQTEKVKDAETWWSIHDKDTYVCPDCGRTQAEHGKKWHVHHINRQQGKIVGLCSPCHKIRHGADVIEIDVEAWKAAFLGKNPSEHREDRTKRRHCDIRFNGQSGDTI